MYKNMVKFGRVIFEYVSADKLEKASTHKSAKTHAGNVLWLVTLTPK